MEKIKKDDPLLADLDFNEEIQTFGSEDDARTYDFRVEEMLERKRLENPDYRARKALAELIIELSQVDDGTFHKPLSFFALGKP